MLATAQLSTALFTPSTPISKTFVLKSSFTLSQSLAQEWLEQPYPPSPDHPLDLRISLAASQTNIKVLEHTLFANSDPSNPQWTYRPHMTKHEVAALASPPPQALPLLHAHLLSFGIDVPISSNRDSSSMEESIVSLPGVPIRLAERLLNTTYRVYKNVHTGREIVRALAYSLPENLVESVDWVQPTNYFGSTSALWAPARLSSSSPSSLSAVSGTKNADGVFPMGDVSLGGLKDLYHVGELYAIAVGEQ